MEASDTSTSSDQFCNIIHSSSMIMILRRICNTFLICSVAKNMITIYELASCRRQEKKKITKAFSLPKLQTENTQNPEAEAIPSKSSVQEAHEDRQKSGSTQVAVSRSISSIFISLKITIPSEATANIAESILVTVGTQTGKVVHWRQYKPGPRGASHHARQAQGGYARE